MKRLILLISTLALVLAAIPAKPAFAQVENPPVGWSPAGIAHRTSISGSIRQTYYNSTQPGDFALANEWSLGVNAAVSIIPSVAFTLSEDYGLKNSGFTTRIGVAFLLKRGGTSW